MRRSGDCDPGGADPASERTFRAREVRFLASSAPALARIEHGSGLSREGEPGLSTRMAALREVLSRSLKLRRRSWIRKSYGRTNLWNAATSSSHIEVRRRKSLRD